MLALDSSAFSANRCSVPHQHPILVSNQHFRRSDILYYHQRANLLKKTSAHQRIQRPNLLKKTSVHQRIQRPDLTMKDQRSSAYSAS